MSKLSDLQTDRGKIIELTGIIERMEKEKAQFDQHFLIKQNEINAFEARALKTRTDLEDLKKKADESIKQSEKKAAELLVIQSEVKKGLEEAKALNAENQRIERDNASRFNVLEGKEARLNSLDLEVSKKVQRWREIQEAFLLIK